MLTFIRARRQGKLVALSIRQHLVSHPLLWKVGPGLAPGQSVLTFGKATILLSPNQRFPCVALLDLVRVSVDGATIHAPLPARLRLRAAARLVAAEHAAIAWSERPVGVEARG